MSYGLRGFGQISDDPPCCAPFKLDATYGKCLDATGLTPNYLVTAASMGNATPTAYAGETVPANWMACLRTIPGTEPVATDPSIQWGGNGAPILSTSATSAPVASVSNGFAAIPWYLWAIGAVALVWVVSRSA